jgi:hypothetical protein
VDPYEGAMHNHPDGGGDNFFSSERHSSSPNTSHNKVCILFNCSFNSRPFFSFSSIFLQLCLSIFVVFLMWIVLMIGIAHHQELVIWMWQQRVSFVY